MVSALNAPHLDIGELYIMNIEKERKEGRKEDILIGPKKADN